MSRKLDISLIRESFEKEGYELLSNEYIDNKTPLNFKCPNGHIHKIRWADWSYHKQRCRHCLYSEVNDDMVRISFEKEGYKLLSTYINKTTLLNFICPNGHRHSISWVNWNKGKRCGRCKGNILITLEDIIKTFNNEGYTVLSTEYKSSHDKIHFTCPNMHNDSIRWTNWQQGRRCKICAKESYVSKVELEIREYIKTTYNVEIVCNDRNTILNEITGKYLELDIYIPAINLAIEVNGVYYHSFDKVIENDHIKRIMCDYKGIKLLVITDDEWYNKKDEAINKIHNCMFEVV